MPRAVRHEYPGAVYHAMSRGNDGRDIFLCDDGRRLFLATVKEVCEQTGWILHAFVLMNNHYHWLLETPEPNLVAGMKWFQGTYTQRFNAMFRSRGHLFQGRYKALPVEAGRDASYFREVGQYIHLNPFRAGLAGAGTPYALESYVWSSYPDYVSGGPARQEWLRRDRLLRACGLDENSPGVGAQYRRLIAARMQESRAAEPDSICEEVEKQLRRGWYVGGESFRKELAGMIGKPSDNLRGLQRRAHDEAEAECLLANALAALGLSEDQLAGMKCTQLEKQAVCWLLKKHTTVSVAWLADRLCMGHRTNASRAVSAFERASGQGAKCLKKKMLQFTG